MKVIDPQDLQENTFENIQKKFVITNNEVRLYSKRILVLQVFYEFGLL